MGTEKGLLIYSGGMDSTVLLYDLYSQNKIELAITFNYGSKHNDKEYEYALRNTKKLNINHIRIDIRSIMDNFKSDLLQSGGDIPEGHYAEESMKKTVVPFRNGIMLSIAAGIAESKGLNTIFIANHAGDHYIYKDCTPLFIESLDLAIQAGTDKVKLKAPYTNITKQEIAKIGEYRGVNFSDTWSCYKGNDIHCGRCGTCVERILALKGLTDTTVYADTEFAKNYEI